MKWKLSNHRFIQHFDETFIVKECQLCVELFQLRSAHHIAWLLVLRSFHDILASLEFVLEKQGYEEGFIT
ncbi:hypothetical protein NC653_034325 [Populus alba x Populus x berolinensis]|uniref:Uncharacterized protein n=1 Tax=Populus alba x Populus x berolinensis TaxID=444605 RepID=A0AAD6PW19_9ROSI|nr:hypothetical protein NC653_034325 [Populus alba x Populus x berolinensis]